jgi:hypothetical protein
MKHFGGKFVRYKTGFKNTFDIVFEAADKGQCNHKDSDINFAMPSEHIIRNFNPYNLTGLKRCPYSISCSFMLNRSSSSCSVKIKAKSS